MLVIRFLRVGKKNQPFFRIVVTDKKNPPRGGRFLEVLGFFNPLTKEKKLKAERIKYWLSVGAQSSSTVHNLLVKEKVIEGKKIDVHKKPKKKPESEKKLEEKPAAPAEAPATSAPVEAQEAKPVEEPAKEPKKAKPEEAKSDEKPKKEETKEMSKEAPKEEKPSEEKPKEESVKEPEEKKSEKTPKPLDK